MAEQDYLVSKGLRMLKPGAKKAAKAARRAESKANWANLDETLASAKQQRAIKDRIAANSGPAPRPFQVNVAPRGTHGARTKPVNRDLLNDLR